MTVVKLAVSTIAWASVSMSQATASSRGDQPKAVALYAPIPPIPEEARIKHIGGTGLFLCHVRSNGTVWKVEVLRSTGHYILDTAAIAGFAQWRFKPGTTQVRIPLTFKM
jgi:TonB family protein